MKTLTLSQFGIGNCHNGDVHLLIDASMLGPAGQMTPNGIRVTSEKTGRAVEFAYSGVEYDAAGEDIHAWHYRPTDAGFDHRVTKLIIVND